MDGNEENVSVGAFMDHRVVILMSGILLLLVAASWAIRVLQRHFGHGIDLSILNICRSRVQSWWILFVLLICSLLLGKAATTLFFFMISFWALREYITLTPTRPADHRTLFWVFFLLTPIQYLVVGMDDQWFKSVFGISSYQVYSILIPAYSFLILSAAIATSNDPKGFLERVAKIQVGLVICVYSLSFAPALLTTTLPLERDAPPVIESFAAGMEEKVLVPMGKAISDIATTAAGGDPHASVAPESTPPEGPCDEEAPPENTAGDAAPDEAVDTTVPAPRSTLKSDRLCLLIYFVFLVQMSDVFQYLWSHFFRKGVVAPTIHAHRTWPGIFAGAMSTALLALGLWYFTPFRDWWQPLVTGFVISLMGFAGSMTMSAIKRDRGVDDYGTLVEGHNGVLDRIDSVCFAAPVFYHLVWIFLHY
ncbi:MAG: phosphatidate cytidylyltransferase [Thermoguttaceae bacterium]|nr:phosphatidate cytidylyltransferase [Thermoguttaceae bacterium]